MARHSGLGKSNLIFLDDDAVQCVAASPRVRIGARRNFMLSHFEWQPKSLTWEGHEFLDAVRHETVWAKTKEVVKSKGGSVSFEVLKELAIQTFKSTFLSP